VSMQLPVPDVSCVWLLSLDVMFLRFIRVLACINTVLILFHG
jgi:hypothetical protein